jgi:hypothetical protein
MGKLDDRPRCNRACGAGIANALPCSTMVAPRRLFSAAFYIDFGELASRFVPCKGQFGSGSINMPAGSLSCVADS